METLKYKIIKNKTQYKEYCNELENLIEKDSKSKEVKDHLVNLSDEIKTLTQVLKENSYKTLFFGPQSDPNLPLKRGLGRSFDTRREGDTTR